MATHTTAILLPAPNAAPWHPASAFRAARATIADNAVVKAKASAQDDAQPMPNARVRLHHRRTGAVHWQGLSGPDGRYHAADLIPGANYIPVALDPSGQFEAVAAGPVRAKLVPGLVAAAITAIIGLPWAAPIFAEGASPAHVITHTSGALPAGVSYSPVAGFSGTPSGDPGDYPLVMTITDANGEVDAPLVLRSVLVPLEIIGDVPGSLAVDEPMDPVVFRARGGEGPYAFDVVGDLPSGLSLTDNGDGTATLGGTPDEAGAFNFSVRATDARSNQALVQLAGNVSSGEDPHWDKVVALLHFDGDLTDETGRAWESVGSSVVSSDESVFGGSSLKVPTTAGLVRAADSADFDFGSGDFTIEFFLRPASVTDWATYIDKRLSGSYYAPFVIQRNGNLNQIRFGSTYNAGSWAVIISTTHPPVNVWTHVVYQRRGGVFQAFLGGVQVGSFDGGGNSLLANNATLNVGAGGSNLDGMVGYIDELRITKGVARYTEDFDPPTEPFPDF